MLAFCYNLMATLAKISVSVIPPGVKRRNTVFSNKYNLLQNTFVAVCLFVNISCCILGDAKPHEASQVYHLYNGLNWVADIHCIVYGLFESWRSEIINGEVPPRVLGSLIIYFGSAPKSTRQDIRFSAVLVSLIKITVLFFWSIKKAPFLRDVLECLLLSLWNMGRISHSDVAFRATVLTTFRAIWHFDCMERGILPPSWGQRAIYVVSFISSALH